MFASSMIKVVEQLAQLVECQTLDHMVAGSNLTKVQCCVLEQDTSSSLLSTGSFQENVPT